MRIHEYEPLESLALLARDDVDLALVYDYDLAPAGWRDDHVVPRCGTSSGGSACRRATGTPALADLADRDWIVNSRNTADEDALRTLASRAGFVPHVVHRIDALELVEDLIVAGRGVALLPRARASRRGVSVVRLRDPEVRLRAYAVTRRGREAGRRCGR